MAQVHYKSRGATNKKKKPNKKQAEKKKGAKNKFGPTDFLQQCREEKKLNPPPAGKRRGTRSNPGNAKGTSSDNRIVINDDEPILTERQ